MPGDTLFDRAERFAPASHDSRPSYKPPPREGWDPATRRMVLLAGGLGAALLLIVGYRGLNSGHSRHTIPIVEAEAGPIRIRPADPGGMRVSGAEAGSDAEHREGLAAPPEAPALGALRAQSAHPNPAIETAALRLPVLATTPAPPPGGATAQLAVFATEDAARQAWAALSSQHAALLAGFSPAISRAEIAGQTVFRLRTGAFASPKDAAAFCVKIRAAGSDCAVAS